MILMLLVSEPHSENHSSVDVNDGTLVLDFFPCPNVIIVPGS